jgi:uncharacterized membrane protein
MSLARRAFGPFFMLGGVMHFVIPKTYESIVPDYLPAKRGLVYASGVAELAGGAMSLVPSTRKFAAKLNIATLLAVFPANVHMYLHPERYPQIPGGKRALLMRLPVQALFILWAARAAE